MRKFISDRQLVVVLFILVFITFSFAHEDSKELEQFQAGLIPPPAAEKTAVINLSVEVDEPAATTEKTFSPVTSLR